MRPEGLRQRKILMTPLGIEPATFQLVAQCLKQLRYRVTSSLTIYRNFWEVLPLQFWELTSSIEQVLLVRRF